MIEEVFEFEVRSPSLVRVMPPGSERPDDADVFEDYGAFCVSFTKRDGKEDGDGDE